MKIKRLASFVALFAITTVAFTIFSSASASAADLTWTGAGDGTTTNDQNNWTPVQSPAAGDTIIFPALSGVSAKQITNNSSAVFAYVYFHKNQSVGKTSYTINGGVSARNIIADSDASVTFTGNVALMQHAGAPTTAYQVSAEGDTLLAFESPIMTLGSGAATALEISGDGVMTMNPGSIAGNSTVSSISITGPDATLGGQVTSVPNVNLTIGQSTDVKVRNLAWLGENTVLAGSASMGLLPGSQIGANNIIVYEGSLIYSIAGQSSADIVFTESSRLALMGNARFKSGVMNGNLVIKGNICNVTLDVNCNNTSTGKFRITPTNDSYGAVIVAQAIGKENGSNMVNGETVVPPYQTETISNSNSDLLTVTPYRIFIINGSRGKVTVLDNGVLKGTGTIDELDVQAGGRVAPGQSPGILNAGNTALSAGSFFEAELGGTTVGSEYDQLKVTGTVNLGDANLDAKLINAFKPKAGDSFTIIDNDGTDAVVGTFKDLAEGATVTLGETAFKISYVGGDGNDVVLSVPVAVPGTPNTGFAILMANPLITMLGTFVSAGSLFVMARKHRLFIK